MPFPPHIPEKLQALPASPGVYVFRGHDGAALYVGKATSLRHRVRSYFQPHSSDTRRFIQLLEDQLGDLETFVVRTEKEAVLLENQLIKELRPTFNVRLRDDKEFLSIRIRVKDPWPRLEVVRKPDADGARYFGPFHSATAARQTLRLVNRHFQLRTCTDAEMRSRKRPCLQYQIKRCLAPCVYPVDHEAYQAQVESVMLFLDGRRDELVALLEERMRDASTTTDYELAAFYRDQIRAVESVLEGQSVAGVRAVDEDVVGLHREADQAEIALLRVRRGRLVRVETFALRDVNLPNDEVVAAFFRAFYEEGVYVPDEVLVPVGVEAHGGLEALLTERRGGRVRVLAPKRGARTELLALAEENAEHAFREKARAREDIEARLGEVQRRLDLPALPRRIECVDVSHTGGADTVAAVVRLLDGSPDRARYRSFHVATVAGGDDYGAMREVLGRRFARGKADEGAWEHPDLLVVDGGKGQLGVATTVLEELGLGALPVVAIAKEKELASGALVVDRVYVPGAKNPIAIRDSSPALQMLALARDEAHRVSNQLRETLGKRRRFASALDGVRGVGPKTKTRLLRRFGSVDGIRRATDAELLDAGVTERQRVALRHALGAGAVGDEGLSSEPGAVPVDAARAANAAEVSPDAAADAATEAVAVENAFSPGDPTGRLP